MCVAGGREPAHGLLSGTAWPPETVGMTSSLARIRTALAAAATALALLPSAANAATTPGFNLGPVKCQPGGIMQAYPPRVMRPVGANVDFRNPEIVNWSPDL